MKRRRRLIVSIGLVALVLVLVYFTPFSLGYGGRDCGPEMMDLYRYVKDDLIWWYDWRTAEVFVFQPACRAHDNCYARARVSQQDCDKQFYADMRHICAEAMHRSSQLYCNVIARGFFDMVRLFGWLAYDTDAARRIGRYAA